MRRGSSAFIGVGEGWLEEGDTGLACVAPSGGQRHYSAAACGDMTRTWHSRPRETHEWARFV
jgi:hypothetical protein